MSDALMVEVGRRGAGKTSKFRSAAQEAVTLEPKATFLHLATLVESQIIPRLLAAERHHSGPKTQSAFTDISAKDIADFTDLLLADNQVGIGSFIEGCRARGITVEAIYLELLTGAARRLGVLWEDDECNFCEVGFASWRIQQTLYELRPAFFAQGAAVEPTGYRVLLAPLALEQHTLGVMMTAEFFRRAGWDVSSELPPHNDALVDAVRNEHIDLIGLSVSNDAAMATLADAIKEVRRASLNPRLKVMVGGWMFMENPAKAVEMGADFCLRDVRDAVIRGEKVVSQAYASAGNDSGNGKSGNGPR